MDGTGRLLPPLRLRHHCPNADNPGPPPAKKRDAQPWPWSNSRSRRRDNLRDGRCLTFKLNLGGFLFWLLHMRECRRSNFLVNPCVGFQGAFVYFSHGPEITSMLLQQEEL